MADNMKITLTIDTETGSLVKAEQQLKKTGQAAKKTAKATEDLGHATGGTRRQLHGAANMSSNTTKNFSKMQQGIGSGSSGLVGAYATLAANVFAATAAFTALRAGAQTEQLIQGLQAVGDASGRNLGALAQRVREAADGALSLDQALRTAATGASANFDDSQLLGLTRVAKGAALALGRDVGDAQDRLVRGAAKLEPEILDELGIFVRLDDAAEKYAAALGLSASELTRFQKGQAFTNEIITQGTAKFSEIANSVDANPYDKLAATLSDLSRRFLNLINSVLGPFASLLANNQVLLAGFFAMITKGVITAALPALTKMGGKMAELGIKIKQSADAEVANNLRAQKAIVEKSRTLGTGFKAYDAIIIKMKKEKISIDEIRAAQKNLHEYIAKNQGSQKQFIQDRVNLAKQESAQLDQLIIKRKKFDAQSTGAQKGGTAGLQFETRGGAVLTGLDEPGAGGFDGFNKAMKKSMKLGSVYRQRMARIRKETMANSKSNKFFGKSLAGLGNKLKAGKVAFTSFGLSAKVAVKGIFTAIPAVGQLLFAFDLLIVGIKKIVGVLGGWMPAQSALAKSLEATASAIDNVESSTSKSNMANKSAADQLKISATATSQLVSSLEEQVAAQDKANKEMGIFASLIARTIDFGKELGAGFGRTFRRIGDFIKGLGLEISLLGAEFDSFTLNARKATAVFLNGFKQEGDAGFIDIEAMEKNTKEALAQSLLDIDNHNADMAKKLSVSSGEALRGLSRTTMSAIRGIEETLRGVGPAAVELRKALDIGEGKGGINDFVAKMGEGGNVVSALTDSMKEQVKKALGLSDAQLQTADKAAILTEVLKQGTIETKAQGDAVQGLAKIFQDEKIKIDKFMTSLAPKGKSASFATVISEINKETSKLADGGNLQAISDEFKDMGAGLRTLIAGGAGTDAFKDLEKSIKDAEVALSNLKPTEREGSDQNAKLLKLKEKQAIIIKEQVSLLDIIVARQARSEIFDKTRLATINRQNAAIKKAGKDNAAGVAASIILQNKATEIKAAALRDDVAMSEQALGFSSGETKTLAEQNAMSAVQRETYAQLLTNRENLAKVEEGRISKAETQNMLELAGIKNRKQELLLSKAVAANEAKRVRTAMVLSNIGSGRGGALNKRQEFEIAQEAAKVAIKAEKASLEILEQKFILENEILGMRLLAAGIDGKDVKRIQASAEATFKLVKQTTQEKIKGMEIDKQDAGISAFGTQGMSSGLGGADGAGSMVENIRDQIEMVDKMQAKIAETKEILIADRTDEDKALIKDADSVMFQTRIAAMSASMQPMLSDLKGLGPEGELAASVFEGGMQMASAFEIIGQSGGTAADKLAAAATAISAISGIMASSGKAAVDAIDKQIEAEKSRDGKSAESVSKLKVLEAKKEAIKRKAFEQNKKLQMAETIINTAAAIMAQKGNIPMMIAMGIMGATQLAVIARTSYQSAGSAGADTITPPNITIGKRDNRVDVSRGPSAGELSFLRGDRGIGTNANNFMPGNGAGGLRKGYANGGVVVGERGPEVVQPTSPYSVIPNDELGGGVSSVNFTINAIDAEGVQDVLMKQQGNIIGMIRSAANDNGENFLESVNIDYLGGEGMTLMGEKA